METGIAPQDSVRTCLRALREPWRAGVCAVCGVNYTRKRRRGLFCSDACRGRSFREDRERRYRDAIARASLSLPFEAHTSDRPTQCDRLLAALRRGPVTNGQMLYALRIGNHTGRISELRRRLKRDGLTIAVTERDRQSGLTVYALARDEGA